MKMHELEELVSQIARELRLDGAILKLANNHRVSYVDLWFMSNAGHLASGELFHGGRHGDDKAGQYPNATAEETATAAIKLLKTLRNWTALAHQYNLLDIYITVQKMLDGAKGYLYHAAKGSGGVMPDDPLIVF